MITFGSGATLQLQTRNKEYEALSENFLSLTLLVWEVKTTDDNH